MPNPGPRRGFRRAETVRTAAPRRQAASRGTVESIPWPKWKPPTQAIPGRRPVPSSRRRGGRRSRSRKRCGPRTQRGASGLVHAPTGMGKTYAAGAAADADRRRPAPPTLRRRLRCSGSPRSARWRATPASRSREPPPHSRRTGRSTCAPATPGPSARARQGRRLPTALVTTPESLTLFLARADWRDRFASLAAIVVDEWHELMGTKRGVQTELALARLRGLHPRAAHLGAVGHARQSRRRARLPRRAPPTARRAVDHQGSRREDDRHRQPAPAGRSSAFRGPGTSA